MSPSSTFSFLLPLSGRRLRLGLLALGCVAVFGCAPQQDAGSADSTDVQADLVVTHGRVYTLAWGEPAADGTPATDAPHGADGWRPDAEAVAMRDGKIVFVGSSAEAEAFIGDGTRVLDAEGATVLPGLVDAHTHVAGLGELEAQVNLIGVETEDEAVALVAERAAVTPKGEWILGRGWDEGAWANRYPTLEKLSAAVPDHPVVLGSLHGFAVWGNKMALEKAGIDRDTQTPDGGEIRRDASGDPTGILLNRAGPLLTAAVPPAGPDQERRYLLAGLQRMARDGFVAVHEAGSSASEVEILEALDGAGELPIRVYSMLSGRDETLCREWLEKGPRSGLDSKLAVRSVKAYYDAALGSRGARLLEDYADHPGHRGTSGDEYGFDQVLVADMMKGGFQAGIHAIGDAGNRETLDFIASVLADQPESKAERHRIEHAQVIHPDDIPRFAELGVVASMQPPHAVEDKTWAEERLGAERIRGAYAWRTLRQEGAELVFSSDLSGSDHNIFYGLHAAVTRRDKNQEPAEGWYPEEALSAEEAVRAYTVWAARAAHWEEQTGTLEVGRWGDLTLMDIDPFRLADEDPGAILQGRIVATVVAGEVVAGEVVAGEVVAGEVVAGEVAAEP